MRMLTILLLAALPDAGHLLAETGAIELVTVEAPAPCAAEPLCALPSGEPADCSRPSAVALWGPWWAPVVETPQARLIENYIRSLLPEMDAAVEALEAAETPRAAN